jgi:hypothetical protein
MDFLRSAPAISLGDERGHEHLCFCADLFEGRPSFQNIQSFQEWAEKQQDVFTQKMNKKACPVKWLGMFVDDEGAMLIATRHSGTSLNNMRVGLKTLLSALPEELQKAVATTLRPLDELDKVRIDGWQTVNDLREDSEEEGSESPAAKQTVALLLKEPIRELEFRSDVVAWYARDWGGVDWKDGRMIAWAARAQAYATICLVSTGDLPALTYIRCPEKRRRLLLVAKVREEKAEILADVARIAAALAKDGSLPAPGRQRNCEFLRRCVEALKVVNPKAETEVSNLPKEEQAAVRRALGGEVEPYQGCLSDSCLDEETVWETDDLGDGLQLSRCARCRFPKAMGRSVATPLDLIRESLKRERGATFARTEERLRNVRQRIE